MTDRGHVYQPGENPLAPHPMTPAQFEAFMEAVRANTTPAAVAVGRLNRRRWERYREQRGRP